MTCYWFIITLFCKIKLMNPTTYCLDTNSRVGAEKRGLHKCVSPQYFSSFIIGHTTSVTFPYHETELNDHVHRTLLTCLP